MAAIALQADIAQTFHTSDVDPRDAGAAAGQSGGNDIEQWQASMAIYHILVKGFIVVVVERGRPIRSRRDPIADVVSNIISCIGNQP